MGLPVIFVHGIGASGSVWKKFNIPGHEAFYISFADRFSDPARQEAELAGFIKKILKETGERKVILVCHSMGGLVTRKYLVDHEKDHGVEKLILLSTPNLGTAGLSFNWTPLVLICLGLLGWNMRWPLLLSLIGIVWELTSYLRGVLLLSPAAWAMRPNSKFLKELNSRAMPADVKYVVVLSDTRAFPHRFVNLLLYREGGDGAVPLSSQKLSEKCAPNFLDLDYQELKINLPHFKIPDRAQEAVFQALGL